MRRLIRRWLRRMRLRREQRQLIWEAQSYFRLHRLTRQRYHWDIALDKWGQAKKIEEKLRR